jgi:hypothetical protein
MFQTANSRVCYYVSHFNKTEYVHSTSSLNNFKPSVPKCTESFRSRQLLSYSGISQHFMEPEVSLPCSQEARQWSPTWARWIQSVPTHPVFRISNLNLGLISGHLTSGFPIKNLCNSLLSHAYYMHCQSHPRIRNKQRGRQMQSLPQCTALLIWWATEPRTQVWAFHHYHFMVRDAV